MCKYLPTNPEPPSHLLFPLFLFFPVLVPPFPIASSSPSVAALFDPALTHSSPPSTSPAVVGPTWLAQALSKKENKGGESPELESAALTLTPRTEEKYKQINEEFDHMVKTHRMPVSTGSG